MTLPLWGWLLLVAVPLFWIQRRLHLDLQAVFFYLTGRLEVAVVLFAILFLPGVIVHELSHYLMATILNVRTGRISILPRPMGDGRLQLGYVETARVDVLRAALIGAAPVLAGLGFVAWVGFGAWRLPAVLPLDELISRGAWLRLLDSIYHQPDFWLWFYLLLTVSSTMSPSPSDRRAWLPVALVVGILAAGLYFLGAGDWLAERLARPAETGARLVLVLLTICLLVQAGLWLPVAGLRLALQANRAPGQARIPW